MRQVIYLSGRLSGGGNRHWPSAATRAPRRVPSAASTTVERGARNEGIGTTRMAKRRAARPGITILNAPDSLRLSGLRLRPKTDLMLQFYNAVWPKSHIAHRNSVWPKSHIAHRTSQFCMAKIAHRTSHIAILYGLPPIPLLPNANCLLPIFSPLHQIPAGVQRKTRHRVPRKPPRACCNCHGTRPSE